MVDQRYDQEYEFHIAGVEELPLIMDFIGKYWNPEHILSCDRDFFMYQYGSGNAVNMILAYRKATGELEGLLGFIPASDDPWNRDVWGSMWKVREGNMLFLGVELINRLLEYLQCRSYMAPGINMATTGKVVGRRYPWIVGRMKHWYVLRQQLQYRIAVISDTTFAGGNEFLKEAADNKQFQIKQVFNKGELEELFDFDAFKFQRPYKDSGYIRRRYFDHPIFRYEVFAVMTSESGADAFFVTREVSAAGGRAIRLVDFVGNKSVIAGIGRWICDYLETREAEYIDFYEYGFHDDDIKLAGFTERTADDSNIIPDHFSPFERKNVEIYFHAPDTDVVICKADGDQDRPNQILMP